MRARKTIRRPLAALLALAALPSAGLPGDGAAAPQMDALAREMLEKWDKLVYRLDRAGMARCSFSVAIGEASSRTPEARRAACFFQGGTCSMQWEADARFDGLHRTVFARALERELAGPRVVESLDGCRLTGVRKRDGSVVLSVEGPGEAGIKELVFDDEGALLGLEAVTEVRAAFLFDQQEQHHYAWGKEDRRFLLISDNVSVERGDVRQAEPAGGGDRRSGRRGGGGGGAAASFADWNAGAIAGGTRTYVRAGPYIVPASMEITVEGGYSTPGTPYRVEFSGWQFDAAAAPVTDNSSAYSGDAPSDRR
jgi:hypothetical protein